MDAWGHLSRHHTGATLQEWASRVMRSRRAPINRCARLIRKHLWAPPTRAERPSTPASSDPPAGSAEGSGQRMRFFPASATSFSTPIPQQLPTRPPDAPLNLTPSKTRMHLRPIGRHYCRTDYGTRTGARTTRNPTILKMLAAPGSTPRRMAARHREESLLQLPPRKIRSGPLDTYGSSTDDDG